jgi:hypothetical protein
MNDILTPGVPAQIADLYASHEIEWEAGWGARFWPKVNVRGIDDCWLWKGGLTGVGYGQFWNPPRAVGAHRFIYEMLVGPIPEGLHIDHLCRNRRCVNPAHLEAVEQGINTMRGRSPMMIAHLAGTCVAGHPASDSYRRKSNGEVVYCRQCRADRRAKAGQL